MHLEPRLFLRIGSKTEVEISGLTLAGGREGISNFGYLTVSATARFPTTSVIGRDSELIVHLTLIGSTVSGNSKSFGVSQNGGGIWNSDSGIPGLRGNLEIVNSTISGNTADG